MVKIITDSGADFRANALVDVVPLTVRFGDEEFQDGVNLSHHDFYCRLVESDEMPQTSQATPFQFAQAIEKARDEGADEILIITLSGKLSGTYNSARMACEGEDGVYLVDSENVTLGQKILVERAEQLVKAGRSAGEIKDILDREKKDVRLIALLDTLEYLRKGGRVSAVSAMAGGLLNIKPVISIEDGEVKVLGKARGSRKGNNFLREQVKLHGIDYERPYVVGFTGLEDWAARKYVEDSCELWESDDLMPQIRSVGGAIGTHAGPGAVAVAWFAKEK